MPSVSLKASGDASCVITNQVRAGALCLWDTHDLPADRNRIAFGAQAVGWTMACRKAGHSPSPSHEPLCLRGLKQCCMAMCLGRFAKSVLGGMQCVRVCGTPVGWWCTPLLPAPWAVGTLLSLYRTKPSHLRNGSENCVHSLGLFFGPDEKVPAKYPEL